MRNWLLCFVIVAMVFSCIFPPWRRIYKEYNSNIKKFEPVGYSFITKPPTAPVRDRYGKGIGRNVKADTIDFGRLGIQVGLLLFLGGCIVFSRYIFRRTEKKIKMPTEKKGKKGVSKYLVFLTFAILTGYSVGITLICLEIESRYLEIESKYMHLQKTNTLLEKINKSLTSNLLLNNLPAGFEIEGLAEMATTPKQQTTKENAGFEAWQRENAAGSATATSPPLDEPSPK